MSKLLLSLGSALAILGCANADDIASQTTTLTGFCHVRAETECNSTIVAACQVPDTTTCVNARVAACMTDVPQGTAYVPTAAVPCIQAVTAAYASATLTAAALADVATACEPVFSGPGPARAPCTVDYDCSTEANLRCIVPVGETSGKCLVPNVVQPAAPCPGEADVCPTQYYCDPTSLVCVAQAPTGAQCDYRVDSCLPGNICPASIFSTTCEPLKASGDPCTTASECASNLCDKATGQSQGVCADSVQLTPLDSMCAVYQ